jgi:hypothetical protein
MSNTQTHNMFQRTFTDGTGARDVYTFQMINGALRQTGFERFEPVRETFRSMAKAMEDKHGAGVVEYTTRRTYRNGGCCVIFSIAYATGQDPRQVQNRAFEHGHQLSKAEATKRRKHNNATWRPSEKMRVFTGTHTTTKTIHDMTGQGWKAIPVDLGKSVGQAQKKAKDGMYILNVRGHVLVLDNGCIVDNKCEQNKNARRLKGAWQIVQA